MSKLRKSIKHLKVIKLLIGLFVVGSVGLLMFAIVFYLAN